MLNNPKISQWLSHQNTTVFSIYAILASFLTYSCMYAFRKPFSVAMFDGLYFLGIHYKIWLITAQVLGYTISKFMGIKIISEMNQNNRAITIISVIAIAEIALLLFALTPAPYNILFLFLNGLPLGLVWGLVLSYLEGRKTTELLSAGLSVSFIFASGFVKSVGQFLMLHFNVSEFWMPFATGLVFSGPLIIAIYFLNQIPPPNTEDITERTARVPMNKKARRNFLKEFSYAIVGLIIAYIALTILRDIRDNYAAELWRDLGVGNTPELFTLSEIPVGLGVLAVIAFCFLIKDNLKALYTSLFLIILGFGVVIAATLSFQSQFIGGTAWMILVGFGLYLGYIAFHTIVFERLIAAFRYASNIGFIFYLADAFGYLGSIGSFLMKNYFSPQFSWLTFYKQISLSLSISGIIFAIVSLLFLRRKYLKTNYKKAQKKSFYKLSLKNLQS